jgi:ligand-binding sensor domain-containing protein/signal transduction histidine kinase
MFTHRLTASTCVALLMTAGGAQANQPGVRIARIDPQVIHLEVVDHNDIRFARLSHTAGISQTRVTAIVQDEPGFLWFATLYGLNRYDGYVLRRFKHVDTDPHSVSDSLVRALFKDREGRLWIGSQGILDRYDPTTETFIHYPLNVPVVSDSDLLPRHISQDNQGMLWLATSVGLYRLDPASGRTQGFRHRANDPASLSSDFIQSSGVDRAGTLWVATREGLDAFDPATDRVTMHVPIRELREPSEMSFYEDRSGTFWIRQSSGEGLATLDRKSGVVTRYSFSQRPAGADTLTGVSSILEDAAGQLWIGTHSDGLLQLDVQHRRALRYRNDPFNPESLAENRITTLTLDREGDIWVGLGASEPNHFRAQPAPFRPVPFDAANPYNLGERLINTLYEDSSGALWVGTTGALNRLDRGSGSYQRIEVPGTGNSDILSIIEARSGVLWVGTSGQGLERMDLKSHVSRLYRHRPGDPASLASDTVLALHIDPRGTLWAATIDGLSSFDAATEQFHTFRYGAEGSAIYTKIAQDNRGMFWISGPSGVLEFDPTAGKFMEVPELRVAKGYAVLAAANGEIWAGTQAGLYRFNPATRAVRVYSESDGLASIAISCVLEDANGNIWMSTTEGVSRLLVSSDRFRNYSVEDGLPGRDLTGWSACSRSRSGMLNFGGFAGGVTFDPRAVVDDAYAPAVTLTGLELAGIPVTLGHGSPLTRAIGYTHDLRLSSNQRNFGIEFAALSFRSPATNRYRYRLDDLDTAWHEVGAERRVANYTTLPPGSYTFRVQGATNRGPWSEPGVAMRITIDAPWWARWEFRALLTAIALGLGVSIYRYRLQQITRSLEIRFDERIRERTRIARDLHDSLLQGFTGLTLKFHALAYSLGADNPIRIRIEDNLRHARELMEETRARVRDLRSQDEPQASLEELLKEFTGILPGSTTTQFELRVVGVPRRVDSMAFDEILLVGREAIANAISHAAAARVEVELTYSARELTLRVSDDGKGMDAQTLEAGRKGHWGLQGMRERAQSLGASLDLWSRPAEGTDIQLVVPGSIAYPGSRSRSLATPLMRFLRRLTRGPGTW